MKETTNKPFVVVKSMFFFFDEMTKVHLWLDVNNKICNTYFMFVVYGREWFSSKLHKFFIQYNFVSLFYFIVALKTMKKIKMFTRTAGKSLFLCAKKN